MLTRPERRLPAAMLQASIEESIFSEGQMRTQFDLLPWCCHANTNPKKLSISRLHVNTI
jgi:hypothetical protein